MSIGITVSGNPFLSISVSGAQISGSQFISGNISSSTISGSTLTGNTLTGCIVSGGTIDGAILGSIKNVTGYGFQWLTVPNPTLTFSGSSMPVTGQYVFDIECTVTGTTTAANSTSNIVTPNLFIIRDHANSVNGLHGLHVQHTIAGATNFYGDRQAIFSYMVINGGTAGNIVGEPTNGWNFVSNAAFGYTQTPINGIASGLQLTTSASGAPGATVLHFLSASLATASLVSGMPLSGVSIPLGTYVVSSSSTTVTISNPLYGTGLPSGGKIAFYSYPLTTFITTVSATINSGSTVIPVASNSGVLIGMSVAKTAPFPASTYITATGAGTVTVNNPSTATIFSGSTATFNYFNYQGNLWSYAGNVYATNGATGWSEIIGAEFDVGIQNGAFAERELGILIVKLSGDQVPPASSHNGITFTAQSASSQPWNYGITFSAGWGNWTFGPNTTLVGTELPIPGTNNSGGYLGNIGIVLSQVAFTTAAYMSSGFSVDPNGNITALSLSSTGNVMLGAGGLLSPSGSTMSGIVGLPTVSGAPSGVPSGAANAYMVYDTVDNILWIYNSIAGGWQAH